MTATGEEELLLPLLEPDGDGGGRRACGGRCGRPARVCLCEEMPSESIPTRTKIVIFHQLATAPVQAKCLENFRVVIGRRLRLDGVEIEEKLVNILKTMVSLQACHLKPMIPEGRGRRKN